MAFTTFDGDMMRRALEIARQGIGYASPNPLVGCVLVREGRVIGEGAHLKFGQPHAEPNAINEAESNGQNVAGATAYVTLEPHSHQGKTPPCTDLLISRRIARCVIAMEDPNPLVSGNGVRQLREAGIEVEVGLLEADARELNRFFLKFITSHGPFVTLKLASTLDGRSALANGESKWITSEPSRKVVHELRHEHDAVLVGANTARVDDPALTVRYFKGRQPYRVVIDARLELPENLQLFSDQYADRTFVLTSEWAYVEHGRRVTDLQRRGVRVVIASDPKTDRERVDLSHALTVLGERNIASVLVEAGPQLAASLISADLVDEIDYFMAPIFLGGDSRPTIGDLRLPALPEAAQYQIKKLSVVNGSSDIRVQLKRK